jgi:hypothetical protein
MNVIMIHLADTRRYGALLEALRMGGAQQATICDNSGVDFLFWRGIRSAFDRPAASRAAGKTIFSIVPEAVTQAVVEAAERVLGGPQGAGAIFTWELSHYSCYQGEARAGELAGAIA